MVTTTTSPSKMQTKSSRQVSSPRYVVVPTIVHNIINNYKQYCKQFVSKIVNNPGGDFSTSTKTNGLPHAQTLAAAVGLSPASTGSGTNLTRTVTPRFRIQVHQLARCTLCVRTRLSVYACYPQHAAPNDDDPTPVPTNGTRGVTSMPMDLGSPSASGAGESEYASVGDSALDCFLGCIKEIATKRTGACPYNRPCAHQYVGKYQSCMV